MLEQANGVLGLIVALVVVLTAVGVGLVVIRSSQLKTGNQLMSEANEELRRQIVWERDECKLRIDDAEKRIHTLEGQIKSLQNEAVQALTVPLKAALIEAVAEGFKRGKAESES